MGEVRVESHSQTEEAENNSEYDYGNDQPWLFIEVRAPNLIQQLMTAFCFPAYDMRKEDEYEEYGS